MIALLLFSLLSTTHACVSGSCTNGMYSDVPSNNEYYLTPFCDSSVACGSFSGNCNEYYAADYARFGCNSIISCCQGSDCLNLKVIDGGPGCSVEDSAHKQIVDASYSTCKHFTGSTSCGWSDKIKVVCKKTTYTVANLDETVLGESQYVPAYMPQPVVGADGIMPKPNTVGMGAGVGAGVDAGMGVGKGMGGIPIGPCSYNSSYAAEHGRPLCGDDFDLHFQPDFNKNNKDKDNKNGDGMQAELSVEAEKGADTQAEKSADAETEKEVATTASTSTSSTSPLVTLTSSYSADSAVAWGGSYCAKDSEWLCAEFVARALHQGG
jgi:hypothetical protein